MSSEADDRAIVVKVAGTLEELADILEELMPKRRAARVEVTDIVQHPSRAADRVGTEDEYDMAVAAGLGFDRIEAARKRVAAVVCDFEDDVPRPVD